jgi:hypothetical protein
MTRQTVRNQSSWRGADFRRQNKVWVGWRRRRTGAEGAALDAATQEAPPAAAPAPAALQLAADLDRTEREVDQTEAMIERQRAAVYELRRNGVPTTEAEQTLRKLQKVLFEQRKVLATLQHRRRRGLETSA